MLRASQRITFCSFLQQNLSEVMRPENQTVAVMTVVLFTNQYKGGGTAYVSFTTEPMTHQTVSFPALFLLLFLKLSVCNSLQGQRDAKCTGNNASLNLLLLNLIDKLFVH